MANIFDILSDTVAPQRNPQYNFEHPEQNPPGVSPYVSTHGLSRLFTPHSAGLANQMNAAVMGQPLSATLSRQAQAASAQEEHQRALQYAGEAIKAIHPDWTPEQVNKSVAQYGQQRLQSYGLSPDAEAQGKTAETYMSKGGPEAKGGAEAYAAKGEETGQALRNFFKIPQMEQYLQKVGIGTSAKKAELGEELFPKQAETAKAETNTEMEKATKYAPEALKQAEIAQQEAGKRQETEEATKALQAQQGLQVTRDVNPAKIANEERVAKRLSPLQTNTEIANLEHPGAFNPTSPIVGNFRFNDQNPDEMSLSYGMKGRGQWYPGFMSSMAGMDMLNNPQTTTKAATIGGMVAPNLPMKNQGGNLLAPPSYGLSHGAFAPGAQSQSQPQAGQPQSMTQPQQQQQPLTPTFARPSLGYGGVGMQQTGPSIDTQILSGLMNLFKNIAPAKKEDQQQQP